MVAMTTQQTYGPAAKKMKLEHDGAGTGTTTTTPAPVSATPVPTYQATAPQWSTAQIPIDPALTQQAPPPATHVMTYSHYPSYAGATHYAQTFSHFQQYQPAQPTPTAPAPATLSRQPTQQNEVDNTDIATLNDALGSAGVDLRAEEETLQRSQDHHTMYRSYEDRTRKQPHNINFDSRIIGATMREIGNGYKVSRMPEDSINYVALALRFRLQGLIKAMIAAADHRADAQFERAPSQYEDGTPMWSVVVRRDTKKLLEVLERVEREEEMKTRRERKERADAAAALAANIAAQAGMGGSDSAVSNAPTPGADDPMDGSGATPAKKPKKKKDGPGVTARNMSEEVQKRMSNAVATRGLGLGKYAWMNAGSAAAPAPKAKPAVQVANAALTTAATVATAPVPAANATSTNPSTTATITTQQHQATSWSKPYVTVAAKTAAAIAQESEKRAVTMHDAMFVIERERGHGAGRGAARGWV